MEHPDLAHRPAPAIPIPGTYRVGPRLLAGKYPVPSANGGTHPALPALLGAGVRTFVDLTEDGEQLPYVGRLPAGVTHHRIGVRNYACPTVEQVERALRLLESAVAEGLVYLHCRGGCGRTGVVVGCHLVEHGLDPGAALDRVHELALPLWNMPCPETPEQVEMVRAWPTARRRGA